MMRMLLTSVRNLYLLCIFAAPTFSPLLAEIGGSGRFWFTVDYSRFWGNDTLTYMELYYSVPEDLLTYQFAKERFIGGMNLFVLVSENGNVVAKRDWTMPHSLQDTSQLSRKQNIVGLTTFALPKG